MKQGYIFTFTGRGMVFAVVSLALLGLLMMSAGILIGLQIYPDVATNGPDKVVETVLHPVAADTPGTSLARPDSILMYTLNSLKRSDVEVVLLPGTEYYTLQLGLFTGRERAERRRKDLANRGITSYISGSTNKNKEWYAVRAGIFDNQPAARRAASTLKKKYGTAPEIRIFGAP